MRDVKSLSDSTTQSEHLAKAMLFKYAGEVQRPNPFKQGTPKRLRRGKGRFLSISHRP